MSDKHPPHEQVKEADRRHQEVDPHGKGDATTSGEDATGLPTDDRHDSEKAARNGAD